MTEPPAVVLTISGSDSAGGAGLQADLRTFAACGVHGVCALTVVSAQNTHEFKLALGMPPEMVLAQIETVLADFPVRATKTGFLYTELNVRAIATLAEEGKLPLLVVDPVLVNMHGDGLYEAKTEMLISELLVPKAKVITPNHLEAGRLLGRVLRDDLSALEDAAHELIDAGPEAVVITGGRRSGAAAVDVAVCAGKTTILERPKIKTTNVRGSGDTLSAVVTAELAKGSSVLDAILLAHEFTTHAIARSAEWELGFGQGPISQMRW
ncbi:MAG TPA: bifunctional hydroxymethylpyrimidine kinase/phosphomethylpyrimidine kinase [Acidimicrobiaceae bacterium]|nr:bifunctional hydroxymethylpyrimidine kinase/phosphomethylpyrimidine kinase [Actinomycetota bacterium]NCG40505.1 bifunctional hydroxymethylpyrimidine kinase/phosphomethylpyrimidine kinase [Actinomycetota bacterium]HAN07091.1 bifunctional hydroxymethylpyrimidine kinase/phosphomethylpyrimidine kinase [Acidimicrobiaceae bacterium]